jgi:hypothetical protein
VDGWYSDRIRPNPACAHYRIRLNVFLVGLIIESELGEYIIWPVVNSLVPWPVGILWLVYVEAIRFPSPSLTNQNILIVAIWWWGVRTLCWSTRDYWVMMTAWWFHYCFGVNKRVSSPFICLENWKLGCLIFILRRCKWQFWDSPNWCNFFYIVNCNIRI